MEYRDIYWKYIIRDRYGAEWSDRPGSGYSKTGTGKRVGVEAETELYGMRPFYFTGSYIDDYGRHRQMHMRYYETVDGGFDVYSGMEADKNGCCILGGPEKKLVGYTVRDSEEVILSEGIVIMDPAVFLGKGNKAKRLVIPSSMQELELRALLDLPNLEEIVVHRKNPNYSTVEGILCNKEQTELLFCPRGKTGVVTLPETLKKVCVPAEEEAVRDGYDFIWITRGVFEGCRSLRKVILPPGLRLDQVSMERLLADLGERLEIQQA